MAARPRGLSVSFDTRFLEARPAGPARLSCLLVALGSFSCFLVCSGNLLTAPMYLDSISASLEVDQNIAAFPGALMAGVVMMAGPFASISLDYFGFRSVTIAGGIIGALGYSFSYFSANFIQLCILHGIVAGMGIGFIIQSAMVVLNFYFTKWRRLVSCLCFCGTSIGSMIFPVVFKSFIDETREGLKREDKDDRWRMFLVIQGVTVLLCCIFGLAFRPVILWVQCRRSSHALRRLSTLPSNQRRAMANLQQRMADAENARLRNQVDGGPEIISQDDNETDRKPGMCRRLNSCCGTLNRKIKENVDVRLFKSPTFIILTLSGCIKAIAVNVPTTYLTERYELIKADNPVADYALPVLGVATLLGRITCGLISDLGNVNLTIEQNVALIVAGVASILSGVFEDTDPGLMAFEIVYGFCQGMFNSLRMLMLVDLLGIQRINSSLGLSSLFQGIPLMFGPTLMGSMNELKADTENGPEPMDRMFIVAGCVLILAAVICFPLNAINRWERNKELREAETPID